MTVDEFFIKLGEVRSNFVWAIANKKIRGRIIDTGTKCQGCCSEPYCPINAVARQTKSYSMPNSQVSITCSNLGISMEDGENLVISADTEGGRYREKILEILGLET